MQASGLHELTGWWGALTNELWHGKYYHRAYMETRERPVCLWESGSCCQRRLSLCLSSLKKEREVASFSIMIWCSRKSVCLKATNLSLSLCSWRLNTDVRYPVVFLSHSPTYFFRTYNHSLNLEFANSARLTSLQLPWSSCLCRHSSGIVGMHRYTHLLHGCWSSNLGPHA